MAESAAVASPMSRRTAIARGLAVGGALFGGLATCRATDETRIQNEVALNAAPGIIDLGPEGRMPAWLYNGMLPGPVIRIAEGARLRVRLRNGLEAPTSVHWHGLPQRGSNPMDGVPGVTQRAVTPGGTFRYDFLAEPAGTFFFHSHFGLQIEHGLYAPLIIEPRRELLAYDREFVVVLDDWPALPPEQMLANLVAGRPPIPGMNAPMAGMAAGGMTNVASATGEVGPDVVAATAPQAPDRPAGGVPGADDRLECDLRWTAC